MRELSAIEVDAFRIDADPAYRDELARILLNRCGREADHVDLRRTAKVLFPSLARVPDGDRIAPIVGCAATLRAQREMAGTGDVTDARLDLTATDPLSYPESYGDLSAETRALLVKFCDAELDAGNDGAVALENLLRRHGWPYSERTFYVGPWKTARFLRRRDGSDVAAETMS